MDARHGLWRALSDQRGSHAEFAGVRSIAAIALFSAAADVDTRMAICDVFEAQGRCVHRVQLADPGYIVGFDHAALYAARLDAGDVPHLERYTP